MGAIFLSIPQLNKTRKSQVRSQWQSQWQWQRNQRDLSTYLVYPKNSKAKIGSEFGQRDLSNMNRERNGPRNGPRNAPRTTRSKLNPLQRQLGDTALREDPLVRDELRRALWSDAWRPKRWNHRDHNGV